MSVADIAYAGAVSGGLLKSVKKGQTKEMGVLDRVGSWISGWFPFEKLGYSNPLVPDAQEEKKAQEAANLKLIAAAVAVTAVIGYLLMRKK